MNWSSQRTRIRRFLRDPDGNIWSDALLLRLFNNEQQDIYDKTGVLEGIEAIRVPPRFSASYMQDWEWTHCSGEGHKYQCLRYHHQSDTVCCFRWETQSLGGIDAGTADEGSAFAHPWEAWYASEPGQLVPIWFPENFHSARLAAWDKEPISYAPIKQIQADDPSWVTRSGEPVAYTRRDSASNEFYLYPRPSAPVWDDDSGTGSVDYFGEETIDSEYGAIIDRAGSLFSEDFGPASDIISSSDNVLLIYDARPTDIASDTTESDYPVFLRKYLEYGVIAAGYMANTDGRIESLSDYWEWRKVLGIEAIKRLKQKRRVDRDYRFITQRIPGKRTRRDPRLPDGYPAIMR